MNGRDAYDYQSLTVRDRATGATVATYSTRGPFDRTNTMVGAARADGYTDPTRWSMHHAWYHYRPTGPVEQPEYCRGWNLD